MKFVSTRGDAPKLGFCDAMLAGLASDGGLYVPETWPQISNAEIRAMAGKPYAEVAKAVLAPYVAGEIADADFHPMVDEAYATFHHPAVTPLVQTRSNEWILELYHGPTMAFKDVAMQLLARMMDHVLQRRGERATIVGATSGDTGGAAIEAFRGRDNVDIFILFPEGKVSPVQQRQMTTVDEANVHALAVRGNFDDCQALLKAMFKDQKFRDKVKLSGVNSINWGRIMAQVVYYFVAASALGAPSRKISFTVPTGNFGDVFAGYVAKKMGLPIEDLVIATNQNDILARTLKTGRYEITGVSATTSPSMDIQVSSNFERLLFEASGRDEQQVKRYMAGLAQSGSFTIADETIAAIREDFDAGRFSEKECSALIKSTLQESGYLIDPHTAVALGVARRFENPDTPMITLSTAHPAKFPAAIENATGTIPALPEWQKAMMQKTENFKTIDNDLEAIEKHVMALSRVGN